MTDRIQTELFKIADEIESNGGVTDEIRDKLRTLLSNASLLIALGPTGIFVRHNEEDNRTMPDEHDYGAYQALVSSDDFGQIFDSEEWGTAVATMELTDFQGTVVPGMRVYWDNKVAFVKDFHNKEEFPKQVEQFLARIGLLLAPKWIEWKVELE